MGIALAPQVSMHPQRETFTIPVTRNEFADVAAGGKEIDVRLPRDAQPGDTIVLEEVEAGRLTGRKLEAVLTGIDPSGDPASPHVRFEPKQSKYTPTA